MTILQKLIYSLNVLAVVALLFAYISPYVNPSTTRIFSFFGLTYTFILIINILFVIYWLISKPKVSFLSLLFILLGFSSIVKTIGFNKEKDVGNGLKIMSYNVGGTHMKFSNKYKKENIKAFKDFILVEQPDVVCLQERTKWQVDIYKDIFPNFENHPSEGLGTCIYTRHPIKDKGVLANDSPFNNATWVDISVKGKLLRIYSLHLSSNKVTNLTDNMKEMWDESIYILDKYNLHAIRRVKQLEQILAHAKKCKHPVFINGDFNDVPQSYVYNMISEEFVDAFNGHGNGFAKTFNSRFPGLRIDFAFADKKISVLDFDIIDSNLSDHYPILTTVDTDW